MSQNEFSPELLEFVNLDSTPTEEEEANAKRVFLALANPINLVGPVSVYYNEERVTVLAVTFEDGNSVPVAIALTPEMQDKLKDALGMPATHRIQEEEETAS